MKPAHIALGVVLAIALAGAGFAAGMTVGRASGTDAATTAQPTGAAAARAALGQRLGQGGQGALAAQATVGRVLSVNDGSITIETRQPGAQGASPTVSSQIVLVGGSTRIVKTAETEIRLSDLKANDQVTIVGSTDANGNLSATAIVAGGNALQNVLGGQGFRIGPPSGTSPSPTARP